MEMVIKWFSNKNPPNVVDPNAVKPKVLPLYLAMFKMLSGDWLTKNDYDISNAKKNFLDENVNLSLVCALLFTSFLPIFYSESLSMNDPTQGLALDVELSWLSYMNYQYLSAAFIHDLVLFFYAMAMGSSCLGTLLAVFFTFSASQCDTNEKTIVLMNVLGMSSRLPYFFFATSVIMWGAGAYLKIILTTRTVYGFAIILFAWAFMCLAILVGVSLNVRGIYVSYELQRNNPSTYLAEADIDAAIVEYFTDFTMKDVSYHGFVDSISKRSYYGYRIPLHQVSDVIAKKKYYEEIAKMSNCSFDEVLALVSTES